VYGALKEQRANAAQRFVGGARCPGLAALGGGDLSGDGDLNPLFRALIGRVELQHAFEPDAGLSGRVLV
jgi:hypothetical protein